jgi:ABC-type nitrate/sulfonate/bicarbonate transport system permease component/dihydrodipicolinate synthase/N-acetylneuraminate lyase
MSENHAALADPEVASVPRVSTSRSRWLSRPLMLTLQLLIVVVFLLAWQYLPTIQAVSTNIRFLDRFYVSSPTTVANVIWHLTTTGVNGLTVWPYLGNTLTATVVGSVIGLVCGGLAGLILSNSIVLNRLLSPFVVVINSIPRIALIPIIVLIAGPTVKASIVSAVLVVFFLGFFNAIEGGRSVPDDMVANARLLGATGFQQMRRIRAPHVLIWTFAATPNAISFGLITVVTTEVLTGVQGMGNLILTATTNVDSALSFAVVVILGVVGLALYGLTLLLKRRVLHWLPRESLFSQGCAVSSLTTERRIMSTPPAPTSSARNHPKSTFTISLTPFDAHGDLDTESLRGHLRRMATAGMGMYVGGGGSGEAYTLSDAEMGTVLDLAVAELKGVVPVRAMGREPRTAKEMISFVTMAEKAGVEATQVYSLDVGHGIAPSNTELEAYFRAVLDATDSPVVISTHQSVGYKLSLDMLQRLSADYPHIIGINCTHGDIGYLVSLIDGLDPRLEVHVGGTQQGFAVMALGGTGYLTSEGNLAPALCRSVSELYQQGDLAGSAEAFALVLRLYSANAAFRSIRGIKAALMALGLPGGYPRLPRLPVQAEEEQKVQAMLALLAGRPVEVL